MEPSALCLYLTIFANLYMRRLKVPVSVVSIYFHFKSLKLFILVLDKAFMQRVGTAGGGNHAHFSMRGRGFCIKHYAGDVTYEIEGMVEKNKDALFKDLLDVTGISSNQLLQSLFPEAKAGTSNKPTTSTKIRTQANLLYKTLAACSPHYVRCVDHFPVF